MPEPIKPYQEFVDKNYNPDSKLDWRPESWLGERAESVTGPKYTEEDVRIFRSHVPEYKKIEREARKNGTWLQMPDGTTWTGDPREWVMMQSEAFKKNYQDNPWYTGQAEWATKVTLPNGTVVDTDKVKRARYHNGEMWFSNDAGYAQYFADIIDSSKLSERYHAGSYWDDTIDSRVAPESKIKGKVFLAGIPKTGNYRHLDQNHTPDYWQDMPYDLTENDIVRTSSENMQNTNDYRRGNIKISGENLKTDDLVNHSRQLGDDGLFIYNVNDGPALRKDNEKRDYKPIYTNEYPWGEDGNNARPAYIPINEFISQPGFTEKIKFIRGNNGNFDPNTDDKYSAIFKTDSPLFAKKGGPIHIKKKNRGKFTEYCGGKVTEECIAKGKRSKNPLTRKRANFASVVRKWKHENGGILKYQNPVGPLLESKDTLNTSYLTFKRTLPDNLRLTPEKDYHMYDYWKLSGKPENFKEGKRRGMFTWDNSDKGYHAGSIAEDRNTGIYHFMKPKHHPTVKYELDWFNKGLQTLEGGKQVPVEGKDKEFWEDFKSKYQLDTTGVDYRYVPIQKNGGPLRRPNFKESKEAYYDPETDTVFAPDSLGEFYHHEMFHARPNLQLLESLKPYYHNLNDDVLKQMGADLSFVKRFNNDPGHFYSPEELGARIVSASEMLNRMGVKDVTLDFLKNARLNENAYGDNFRDLIHMYNDENLIKIFNTVKKHKSGGILKAQNGTGNFYTPHPLSPVGIALNQAKAMTKMKEEQPQQPQQHLPPGVKEVIGPDGKKIAFRTEQPLVPLEQGLAEWLPGTGDVAEVDYIVNDVKNGNLGSAALAAGLMVISGNVNKLVSKSRIDPIFINGKINQAGIQEGLFGGKRSAESFMGSRTYKDAVAHDIALAKRAFGYDINPVVDDKYIKMPVKVEGASLGPHDAGIMYPSPSTNNPIDDRILVDVGKHKTVNDLAATIFHENLHHGRFKTIDPQGNTIFTEIYHPEKVNPTLDFYRWKLKHLFKPEVEIPRELLDHYKYLTSVEIPHNEGATNVLELGFLGNARAKSGYPGAQEVQRILDEVRKANPQHAYTIDLLNMKKPKRVWEAMTGQYEDGGKLTDDDYRERVKKFLLWKTVSPEESTYIKKFKM